MSSKILINARSLEHDFIPSDLPRREKERKTLIENLRDFFESGDPYTSWILFGDSGVGKTVLSKRVSEDLKKDFRENIIVAYVNCRGPNRRVYRALTDLVRQVEKSVPSKGLSQSDLINILFELVAEKAGRAIFILDELGALFWEQEGIKAKDLLYTISRFTERMPSVRGRAQIAVIAIVSKYDESVFYKWLDRSTRASFLRYELQLNPYNEADLFDILKYRAKLAFRPGTVLDEAIELISSFVAKGHRGNARIAIDILKDAGKLADKRNDGYLGPKHVRLIQQHFLQAFDPEAFENLTRHKLILLIAIVRALKSTGKSYVTRVDLETYYRITCEEYNERPRRTTQLLRYLKELEMDLPGIVDVEVSGKGQRGRSTRIRINVPLDDLERRIQVFLDRYY